MEAVTDVTESSRSPFPKTSDSVHLVSRDESQYCNHSIVKKNSTRSAICKPTNILFCRDNSVHDEDFQNHYIYTIVTTTRRSSNTVMNSIWYVVRGCF